MNEMDVMRFHTMASSSIAYLSSAPLDHPFSQYILRSRVSIVYAHIFLEE